MSNQCSPSNKTSCDAGYFCPSNVSADATACLVCKSECATCTGDTAEAAKCLTCAPGKYLISDFCTACDAKCATCTAESTCQTCKNGNFLNGTTCSACVSGQTMACTCGSVKNCSTCAADMSKCKTCINNFDPSGGTPCEKCLSGFFKETKDGSETCTACSANCITCTSSSVCTGCENGFSINSNKCVSCADENCTTCTANKDTCTVCKADFSVENNKCEKKMQSR
uniref:Cysteine-rich protein n=1 Tax=Spironucleus salmonicida TaxID=348837 RepID=V6LQ20_9EUKA|eukprot:EST42859.1 Cysteine-rich protein [Spironucleus salmonicida]